MCRYKCDSTSACQLLLAEAPAPVWALASLFWLRLGGANEALFVAAEFCEGALLLGVARFVFASFCARFSLLFGFW